MGPYHSPAFINQVLVMPCILALEASTPVCSVALHHKGEVDEIFEASPKSHTQKMLPMVDSLLARANQRPNDLDAVAFACGPGSFTGLRIATSVAQGLAFGAGVPVISVSTLQTMALGAVREGVFLAGQVCVTCLDARMDEVYIAFWSLGEGGGSDTLTLLGEQLLLKPELWADALASILASENKQGHAGLVLQGDGCDLLLKEPVATALNIVHCDTQAVPRARDVATLALAAWHKGDTLAAHLAEPVYLRGKNAWKTVEEQRKKD
jgi:tRNA threonylcarbamoyladenosine biosynthesis protein TsaB